MLQWHTNHLKLGGPKRDGAECASRLFSANLGDGGRRCFFEPLIPKAGLGASLLFISLPVLSEYVTPGCCIVGGGSLRSDGSRPCPNSFLVAHALDNIWLQKTIRVCRLQQSQRCVGSCLLLQAPPSCSAHTLQVTTYATFPTTVHRNTDITSLCRRRTSTPPYLR
jgi:hypothetical protein